MKRVPLPNKYRLLKDTVVVTGGDRPHFFTLRKGTIIAVEKLRPKKTSLVPVEWESKTVQMFAEGLEHLSVVSSDAALPPAREGRRRIKELSNSEYT